jgi:carbon-monoxide dehydrogenase medium subunit
VRLEPFRLHRPASVEAASDLLDEFGTSAVLYCGGTELLLVAKLGFTAFTELIDIKAIEELSGIDVPAPADGGEWELRIGARTTHRELERSPVVTERLPALARMERNVANPRVRNAGSIGGNLCFADPHSDPATFLIAAGASLSIRRGGGAARRIAVEEFAPGPYRTLLEPGELLVAVHVPAPAPGSAIAHRKMSFHERPAVTVAIRVTVRDGAVADARAAVASVGLRAHRLFGAEQALVGLDAGDPDAEALAAVAEAAAGDCEPVADSNGSVEYKRQLVRVLTARCAADALAGAAG